MPIRVLLADFDKELANNYGAFLRRSGFEVATARHGLQCLEQLRTFRPDILVLEPCILWGGGCGILQLMEDDPDLPPADVIILTSSQDRWEVGHIVNYRIADYQLKPISAPCLLARLFAVLRVRANLHAGGGESRPSANATYPIQTTRAANRHRTFAPRIHGVSVDRAN